MILPFICKVPAQEEPFTTQVIPTPPPLEQCQWQGYWLNPYDPSKEYCYSLGNYIVTRDWEGAKEACEMDGARLVSISNQAENDFIMNFAVDNVWIGMTKINQQFTWIDGVETGYYNWAEGGKCATLSID